MIHPSVVIFPTPLNLKSHFEKASKNFMRASITRPPQQSLRQSNGRETSQTSAPNGKKKLPNGKAKEGRQWNDINSKVTASQMKQLDWSKTEEEMGPTNNSTDHLRKYHDNLEDEIEDDLDQDESGLSEDEAPVSNAAASNGTNGVWPHWTQSGIFKCLANTIGDFTGNQMLDEENVQAVLKEFKTSLMARNVAAEIAEKLAESIKVTVLGKKTERFSSVRNNLKTALKDALERILNPPRSVDVLKAALDAKAQKKVYSIVFLGVNGVGKSTNLAKVAYYLKRKGELRVMMAACDTFRSGAVEQLQTHAQCLDVHLFDRGYGKDPAVIARDALNYAKQNGYDVCLIDTAGRMQDNEPLMRALSKLVSLNSPDLILFVGEALVGNDAVDQLRKFNQCLIDYWNPSLASNNNDPSANAAPRTIDGIILTKFDTVDNKVGAALSMVYVTGQPIVFVGTGQKYGHLCKLQVNTVVKALLA
eukprot:Filipodium_phascolosomae@DN2691_c0_g1_i1.p1